VPPHFLHGSGSGDPLAGSEVIKAEASGYEKRGEGAERASGIRRTLPTAAKGEPSSLNKFPRCGGSGNRSPFRQTLLGEPAERAELSPRAAQEPGSAVRASNPQPAKWRHPRRYRDLAQPTTRQSVS
jgi:hypothetical protein